MNFQNPNHQIKNWNFTMIRNFSFFEFGFERFRSKKFDSILTQFFRNVFADNVVKTEIVFQFWIFFWIEKILVDKKVRAGCEYREENWNQGVHEKGYFHSTFRSTILLFAYIKRVLVPLYFQREKAFSSCMKIVSLIWSLLSL